MSNGCRLRLHMSFRRVLFVVMVTAVPTMVGSGLRPVPDEAAIRRSFEPCVSRLKGPYTENLCVCADGAREPVKGPDGRLRGSPCGARRVLFCAAFRATWAEELARNGIYLGNIFSRDLYLWDQFPDHHDLVRGYLLERYFTENHPTHKLSQLRAFGGLSGAEYEAVAIPKFIERYLSLPSFSDFEHYLLVHDLVRRNFVRRDLGQIDRARNLATRITSLHPSFKPLRDAIHNQVSAVQIPLVRRFQVELTRDSRGAPFDELIEELDKLTRLSERDLQPLVDAIEDPDVRQELQVTPASSPEERIAALAGTMRRAREIVAAGRVSPADARRCVEISVAAGSIVHGMATAWLEGGEPMTVRQAVGLLRTLTDAAYGSGLISEREREAVAFDLKALQQKGELDRARFLEELRRANRIVEWAQNSVRFSFQPVMPAWVTVLPEVAFIGDDVIRASPLLIYARVARDLEDLAAEGLGVRHDVLGSRSASELRVLNEGLAVGRLKVEPARGSYTRQDVVVLRETPAELDPVAGILTLGEGNVVSHVQLLAQNLGIPNVSISPGVMKDLEGLAGEDVFFLATPNGRVIVKRLSDITSKEQAVLEEYTRNQKKMGTGGLGGGATLSFDPSRLDLSHRTPLDLRRFRRKDSGIRCGPKAAFLGELAHLFPDAVSRGVVLPFGAYWEHYQRAMVELPPELRRSQVVARMALPRFVEETYDTFFGSLVGSTSEEELTAWIQPRLELIARTIVDTPLAPDLQRSLREALRSQGLLHEGDRLEVGCFVRSDTNVEDLESFTGAGLNLTVFNLRSLDEIFKAIKDVWASPFAYRSFSWRQTAIDQPLWVLPSIVVLESVFSEKSGVLITADVATGRRDHYLIATSEGVGGAVDGSPAETLLVTPGGTVRLLSQFKSQGRRLLRESGGTEVVESTKGPRVLSREEVDALVAAGRRIEQSLAPARGPGGEARPWDVEFGFVAGKLWLFQVRPFVGNDEVGNLLALRALEPVPDKSALSLNSPLTR